MAPLISILLEFLYILIAGIMAGFLGTLTGLGGGTILVPVLTLFLAVPVVFAAGASIVSTIATSTGGAFRFLKEKIPNVKIALCLLVASSIGAIIGSLTLVTVSKSPYIWTIYIIFGIVLLVSLLPVVTKATRGMPREIPEDRSTRLFKLYGSYYDYRLKKTVEYHGVRLWLGEIIMFFTGFISGLLGIGGGALNVLTMDWAMNLPIKVATTTSNFMIGITAATGSSIYWFNGFIQPFLTAGTVIGVIIGATIGSKVLVKISDARIRWIFFWILSFLGIQMVYKGYSMGQGLTGAMTSYIGYALSSTVSVILVFLLYVKIRRASNVQG